MKNKENIVHLLTAEGKNMPEIPWNSYPRPQLKRDSFFCLNGQWDFALEKNPVIPNDFTKKITVPFAPQSLLSGLCIDIADDDYLIYRKKFILPNGFIKNRVLLHFGAVDQTATVILNNQEIGTHTGGYDAFSFDITDRLEKENTLTVICNDCLDDAVLPYGKQKHKRSGMWYTAVSGIWQTVWLESVPESYIKSIRLDCGSNFADISIEGVKEGTVTVFYPDCEETFEFRDSKAHISIKKPILWSPENPHLYYFRINSGEDSISSYFAIRTLETKIINGIPRLCLNSKPYFFHGLLDQGYYSDGIFTPASPELYEKDITAMKKLGFNTLRKHIKVEPQQFYYDCDRLGMIVFQDMVNNGKYSFIRDTALPTVAIKRLNDKYMHRNRASRNAFFEGMKKTVCQLYNHPSICYWTVFNEGWGQFDGNTAYNYLKKLDSSRFIDTASGWFRCKESDVESIHIYFKPVKIKSCNKPVVLSEFGGYSLKPDGHCYNLTGNYGYKFFNNQADFMIALEKLYENEIIPLIEEGLCGAVYTQLNDVEDETNGLLSYDRYVLKVDQEKMIKLSEKIKSIVLDKTLI